MNIYKLKYTDKETAIADLLAKGVYTETEDGLVYGQGVQAIVEIGIITINEVPVDGYHYDVMSVDKIDFGSAEIFPKNCCHSFAGYAQDADGPIELINE
jgi:hypothetical protein